MTGLSLSFPQVRYKKTSLRAVVCQLRFNPLLRIGQEIPAAFQERVRNEYPKFLREEGVRLRLTLGEPMASLSPPTMPTWRFKSQDENWTVGLSPEFLSLETGSYRDFPDFERRFVVAYEALQEVYKIASFTRVGLRYINIFSPDSFPGGWLTRINPRLLGALADPALGGSVLQSEQVFVISRDAWSITLRHGLEPPDYRLDLDHAIEGQIDSSTVSTELRVFNDRLFQVFRWAITDQFHKEMEAEPRENH